MESYVQADSPLLHRTLRESFGLSGFRPGQLEAVSATLDSRDSLVILPTGGGKSVCYQLPCCTRPFGFTVVICPLIALAKDQADKCDERGIYAERWNCEVSESRKASIAKDMASDEPAVRLLYTTPESLRQPKLLESLKEACNNGNLVSFAVDEAHCVSEWGHDFRSAYLELSAIKEHFPSVPVAALTASCTPKVKDGIIAMLQLRSPILVKGSFNRPNIAYEVRHKELIGDGSDNAALEDLVRFIEERRDECGIIYARLRGTCDWLASALAARDLDVGCYHAGKGNDARARVQRDWSTGGLNVVVATIAFGMGIDRSDVRWVVHWNAPSSMEGFYQESGRAGRDGQPSLSILYASQADLQANHKMERGTRAGAVAEVASYAQGACCRRKHVLKFFGEDRGPCDRGCDQLCDVCVNPEAVRRALSRLEQRESEQGSKAAVARARLMGIRVATDDLGNTGPSPDAESGPSEPHAANVLWSRASSYGTAQATSASSSQRAAHTASIAGDTVCPSGDASCPGAATSVASCITRRPTSVKRPPCNMGAAPVVRPSALVLAAEMPAHETSCTSEWADSAAIETTFAGYGAVAGDHDEPPQSSTEQGAAKARLPLLKRPRPNPNPPYKPPSRLVPTLASSTPRQDGASRAGSEPQDTQQHGQCRSHPNMPPASEPGAPFTVGRAGDTVCAVSAASATGVTANRVARAAQGAPPAIKRRFAFKPPLRVNTQ